MAWLFPYKRSTQDENQLWQTKPAARGPSAFDLDAALRDIAALRTMPIGEKKDKIGLIDAEISENAVGHKAYWRGALAALESKALEFETEPKAFEGNMADLNHILDTIRINLGIEAPIPKRPDDPLADDLLNPPGLNR
ncbi:MAG: hypothetical protein PHE27_06820 [Alphaproteobacteria bacterium]|nr:hypothetical protein [Alphaproteobacteria bacterium]